MKHANIKMNWRVFVLTFIFVVVVQLQLVTSFISLSTRRPSALVVGTPSSFLLHSTKDLSSLPEVANLEEEGLRNDVLLLGNNNDETSSISLNGVSPQLVDTSSSSSSSPVLLLGDESNNNNNNDWLSLWKRRLITNEDPLSIHKLSAIAYTISAMIILGTAAVRYFDTSSNPQVLFAQVPQYLYWPTYIFTISNIIMCTVSVRMAFLHRKYDLTARNAFLGTAVSSTFSGFYFLWTSPFGPEVFNNQIVNQGCFAILIFLNVIFIMDTILKVPEVVESRTDKRVDNYNGRFLVDAMGYVLPVAWGLPLVLATGYLDAVVYDRAWFFEQCQYIDSMKGVPGIQANLSYLQVAASVAASYGSLFVTLRDKKLISKKQEIGWISVFSVPVMIWAILGSVEFISYLDF